MQTIERAGAEAAPPTSAPAAPAQEKLADLQHPDAEHLMLGVNLAGLREACELVGFPYFCYKDDMKHDAWETTYERKDHPEMAWLDEAYPHRRNLGYDFCCDAIKAWLKANGHENESICQVLLKRGSKNVRRANLFYSHIQGVELWMTIERMRDGIKTHKAQLPQASKKAKALAAKQRARLSKLKALIDTAWAAGDEETSYYLREHQHRELNDAMFPDEAHLFFWLGASPQPSTDRPLPALLTPPVCAAADYTTLKQCVQDFDLPRIRQLVKEIGLTLAELDFDPQAYLTRSFCILELLATVQGDANLLVQMHFLKAFDVAAELAANPVDAKAAQTRREKDKATIDGFVEAMPGGFERLNATITEVIKAAAVPIVEHFSASKIRLFSKGLTAHDAAVVAEILKSKTSVIEVYLNNNEEIGDEGAKAFAEALKVNTTLKALYLGICGIGDDGAAALAEALKVNTTVERLHLCSDRRRCRSRIGDDGAAALAEALRSNTSLMTLYLLDGNGISGQGEQLLRDAVAGRVGFELPYDNGEE